MADMSGHEVVKQANDNSIQNTDPALVRGTIVGIVAAVCSILVLGGYIDESQKQSIIDNVGIIVPALVALISIIQAIWTRMAVYSPRSAAKIAVTNAAAPAGTPPTLAPPP